MRNSIFNWWFTSNFFFSIDRFLKKKRNSGCSDNTIIPWRVSSNQDNNYKTNVPINATLIGSVATIVITLGVISRSLFSESTTILAICSLAAGMFQIPLVLAFTIKHQNKTSKINPVVPKTLQFHDDGYDGDNKISNSSNEVNYEANGEKKMGMPVVNTLNLPLLPNKSIQLIPVCAEKETIRYLEKSVLANLGHI